MSWLSKLFGQAPAHGVVLPANPWPRHSAEPPVRTPAPPQEMPVIEYTEAERIALSLRDYPEDWQWVAKGYDIKHTPSGFVLWVASGKDCLAERTRGTTNHRFEPAERELIWPHVEAWLRRFRTTFTGRPVRPRIICGGTYWYCRAKGQPWVGVGTSPESAYRSWSRAISVEQRKEQRPEEVLHVWSTSA